MRQNHRVRIFTSLPLTAALLSLSACGVLGTQPGEESSSTDEAVGPDPAKVEVTVTWMPPSTEESYQDTKRITLSQEEIEHQEAQNEPTTEPMDREEWEDFVADLPEQLDEIGTDPQPSPCVGAGGVSLEVTGAGEYDREVMTTVCGGELPEAGEQIEDLVADFR